MVSLPTGRQEGCLLTRKVEKWGFTGQRRSVVDCKQAWKEAGLHRVLRGLAVSLYFIGQWRSPEEILNKGLL